MHLFSVIHTLCSLVLIRLLQGPSAAAHVRLNTRAEVPDDEDPGAKRLRRPDMDHDIQGLDESGDVGLARLRLNEVSTQRQK